LLSCSFSKTISNTSLHNSSKLDFYEKALFVAMASIFDLQKKRVVLHVATADSHIDSAIWI